MKGTLRAGGLAAFVAAFAASGFAEEKEAGGKTDHPWASFHPGTRWECRTIRGKEETDESEQLLEYHIEREE